MKAPNGGREGLEVILNGAGHLAVRRVEVAMREAVAHPGNVGPRLARLGVQQVGREGFDGLADLDQAYAYGIER